MSFLEHLRSLPLATRKKILVLAVAATMACIATFWIFSMKLGFSNSSTQQERNDSIFQDLKADIKDNLNTTAPPAANPAVNRESFRELLNSQIEADNEINNSQTPVSEPIIEDPETGLEEELETQP